MNILFVNGEYCSAAEAKISIFDRGFLFGDAIYEVLPVYQGQPFFVEQHMARLHANLDKVKIASPDVDWQHLIHQLIAKNGGGDLQIYIQVTRGNQGVRKHDLPLEHTPSVIAFTLHNSFPSDAERTKGLSAKLVDDIRWERCDIKTTSLLANVLLNDEAVSSGYQTSILIRDDKVTEGSTSNVFIVTQDQCIKTPELSNLCLPGITRSITLQLIHQQQWQFIEEDISANDLFNAQEIWITSTTKEIFPITRLNNKLIGSGTMGNYCATINQSYKKLVQKND